MSVGRISGQLLKDNLSRAGSNLSFETDLLYLLVSDTTDRGNHFVGIKNQNPAYPLDITGTARATTLLGTTINAGNLQLTGNTLSSTTGNITLNSTTGIVSISGTGAMQLPAGTTAQQPSSPTSGMLRYNISTGSFEGYLNSSWGSLGGVRSVDGLTYLTAELGIGSSDDTFHFYTAAFITATSWSYSGTTITVNYNNHGLLAGQTIIVTGTTDTLYPPNGTFIVSASNLLTNSFQYTVIDAPTGAGNTGTMTLNVSVEKATINFTNGLSIDAITAKTTNGNLSLSGNGTGVVSITGATGVTIGTPSLGTLSGAVTMTTSTSVTNGIAQLNQTLSLLTPVQPTAFATPNLVVSSTAFSQRIMILAAGSQTNNDSTNIANRPAAGTVVYVSRATDFTTTAFSAVAPGNTGTLTVKRNNVNAVQKLLTYGNSTQTITVNVTATANSSATVSFNSTGVIVLGYQFTAGASAGGFTSGNRYVVTGVTATTLTLANYTNGLQGAAFSGTTASGSPLVVLTSATDIGTTTLNNTSIAITANPAFPASTPGFWETVDVQVTGTGAVAGWNTVQLAHSGSGTATPYGANTTQNGLWYYDNTTGVAPTFASNTFAIGTSNTINSSTIPHYTSSTTYNCGFTLTWNAGQTGHSSTASNIITTAAVGPFQTAGNKTYANLAYTVLPATATVTAGVGPNTTSFAVNIVTGFGAWTTTTTVPVFTADNSYLTGTSALPALNAIILYKTGTTGSTTVLDETSIFFNSSIGGSTTAAFRVVNPDAGTPADTPTFTGGAAAFSTLLTTDATVVGTGTGVAQLKHNVTNYSTGYLPVGPNLTTQNASQYFTFKFVRSAINGFPITITTGATGVAGIWAALPGSSGGSVYGTGKSGLNGWLSLGINSTLFNGCVSGTAFVAGTQYTAQTFTVDFGAFSSSSATNNEIWVRIKLTSGQFITSLYLG
jgi:hypothetical protein